ESPLINLGRRGSPRTNPPRQGEQGSLQGASCPGRSPLGRVGKGFFWLKRLFSAIGSVGSRLESRFRGKDAVTPHETTAHPDPLTHPEEIEMDVLSPEIRLHGIKIKDLTNIDGGFGDVYEGRHPKYGKVALKCLRVENHELFSLEAGAWQTLQRKGIHKGILPFLGTFLREGRLYMVSPWMKNGKVLDYLNRSPAPDRISFSLIVEIAETLAYIHAQGMLHGDIKSSNIIVSDDGHALLCDFGLSRPISTSTARALKGTGSPVYQAPELLNGKPKSAKSDVYAFGITVSEILNGVAWNPTGIPVALVLGGHRPEVPATSSSRGPNEIAWEIAQRCWQPEPEDRPTMDEILQSLRQAQGA
ncbi:hypothetical protein FRB99_008469, partial [Tulasnella sp. 403]